MTIYLVLSFFCHQIAMITISVGTFSSEINAYAEDAAFCTLPLFIIFIITLSSPETSESTALITESAGSGLGHTYIQLEQQLWEIF